MTIPRIIHQTCSDCRQLPNVLRQNIEFLRRANPDWQYRLYDDGARRLFILTHYGPNLLAVYDRINPAYGAARADLFRYLLMNRVGGVYLDMKSTCTFPLSQVINPSDFYLLSNWSAKPGYLYSGWGTHLGLGMEEFQTWHVIASPEHPFLSAAIDNVVTNLERYDAARDGVGREAVLRLTGSIAFTLSVAPLLGSCPYRLVDITDLGFSYSIVGSPGDEVAHKRLLPTHYSTLTSPVVMTNQAP